MNQKSLPALEPHLFRRGGLPGTSPPLLLVAGPLQMLYEPESGFLRRICLERREVLRGIYAAVRDENWRTIPLRLTEFKREVHPHHFRLEFRCEHQEGPVDFRWQGMVEGHPDGSLVYELDGQAHQTFRRNRIGFCVLHPIRECAGVRTRQVRTNGEVVEGRFPRLIEPQIFGHSPFREMRSLAHEVRPGLWARLNFEGDIFELEDQRNWTDASFKTYCTPLALPFPVEIQAGTRIRQKITLVLEGRRPALSPRVFPASPRVVALSIPEAASAWHALPALGLGLAQQGETLRQVAVDRLRQLPLQQVRVDLHLGNEDWRRRWQQALRQARRLGTAIELALHLPAKSQSLPTALAKVLGSPQIPLARVLALRAGEVATSAETLAVVRQCLGQNVHRVPVGAGTDAHFCELNREQALGHVPVPEADFLFWPVTPQVHAFDDDSLLETLEVQGDTVATAAAFAPGKPAVISPVTLRPRFNAVATSLQSVLRPPSVLPENVDPRQSSLLAAGWTLGSLAALTMAGVSSVTYYETIGWRGIMEPPHSSPPAGGFYALPGSVFPIYFVLAALRGFPVATLPGGFTPGKVTALALRNRQGKLRLLVANTHSMPQTIRLNLPRFKGVVRVLDEVNYLQYHLAPGAFFQNIDQELSRDCGGRPISLPPYALVVVDEK